MKALVVGCGYLGLRVARRLKRAGADVIATTRSPERAAELALEGLTPVVLDVLDVGEAERLPVPDVAFHAVGYDRRAGAPMRAVYVDGLRHVLEGPAGRAGRFVLASSTGVYGQGDGSWVDETSPTEPRTESGRVVLEAERAARAIRPDAVILRFAGLYGPDRLPKREALLRGEAIAADPDHWLNLIHVEDAADFAVAALLADRPGPLYVASDDRPLARREFYEIAARLLGAPAPRFAPAQGGPGGRDATSKRASNARILAELGVRCRYPDAAAGLAATLGPLAAGHAEHQSQGAGSI